MVLHRLIKREKNLKPYFKELVEQAVRHQQLDVTDMSQFYLVNLLDEHMKTEQLFEWDNDHYEERALAELLARALSADTTTRIKILKKMGDTSLYIAGYFSEHIDSKVVNFDYYIAMGENAYGSLAGIFDDEKTFAELYDELSAKFEKLVCVLSEVRNSGKILSNTALIKLYEQWLHTGDPLIKERLAEEGIFAERK